MYRDIFLKPLKWVIREFYITITHVAIHTVYYSLFINHKKLYTVAILFRQKLLVVLIYLNVFKKKT